MRQKTKLSKPRMFVFLCYDISLFQFPINFDLMDEIHIVMGTSDSVVTIKNTTRYILFVNAARQIWYISGSMYRR